MVTIFFTRVSFYLFVTSLLLFYCLSPCELQSLDANLKPTKNLKSSPLKKRQKMCIKASTPPPLFHHPSTSIQIILNPILPHLVLAATYSPNFKFNLGDNIKSARLLGQIICTFLLVCNHQCDRFCAQKRILLQELHSFGPKIGKTQKAAIN